MRFSLSLISTAMLASLAMAAPTAPQENSNSEVDMEFTPAQNVALEMSEQFQPFNWMVVDDAKSVDRTFTLNLAEPAQLQITDYKLGGDSFEILDNGEVIGMTSEAANTEEAFVATPEEAFQDERFSHAAFDLAAGEHSITINVANSPYSDGTGAIRLVQKVQAFDKKGKKGGKDEKGGKGKKGGWSDDWDDDEDDEDWDDDEDDWEKDDKKGGWGDDKKGGWGDDKKGGWGDDKKGGWGDDEEEGWGGKKGGWDHDDDWDHDDGWKHKKNTVYVYYTVPGTSSASTPAPTTVTLTRTTVRPTTVTTVTTSTVTGETTSETETSETETSETETDVTTDVTTTETLTSTYQSPTQLVMVTDTETDWITETAVETDMAFISLPFTTL